MFKKIDITKYPSQRVFEHSCTMSCIDRNNLCDHRLKREQTLTSGLFDALCAARLSMRQYAIGGIGSNRANGY